MANVKATNCKFCELSFNYLNTNQRANHTRWCKKNPKRETYINNLSHARSCITNESRKKNNEGIKKAHADGRYLHVNRKTFLGKRHTDASKEKIRQGALNSNHRRLRRGIVEYKGVMLDSSWELALAKRLDDIGVEWIRPEPLKWQDTNGITHNYFPDFYLPYYNLFLDPKNPHAVKVQQPKLDLLLKQHTNIRIITSLEECKEFIII